MSPVAENRARGRYLNSQGHTVLGDPLPGSITGRSHLLGLGRSLGLSTEVAGGAGVGEEAANQRLEERVEDHLGAAGSG